MRWCMADVVVPMAQLPCGAPSNCRFAVEFVESINRFAGARHAWCPLVVSLGTQRGVSHWSDSFVIRRTILSTHDVL
jgi:hypothetical protein